MQHHIGRVVPSGEEPVNLAVRQMRQSGQRMPVCPVAMAEDPGDPGSRQPLGHVRIVVDVHVVVVIDELMADRLAEDQPNRQ